MAVWICFCTSHGINAFFRVRSRHVIISSGKAMSIVLCVAKVKTVRTAMRSHLQVIDLKNGSVIEVLPTEKPFCFINISAESNSTLKAFNYYR